MSLLDFRLPDPPQIWLIVFIDPPAPPPGAALPNRLLHHALGLLRPGFRHVLAVSPVQTGWLVCNPGSCTLTLGVVRDTDVLPPLMTAIRSGSARAIAVLARQPARVRLRGLFTCVNVIAHLTGIECHPFTTPYGLHRRIAAMRP